jgi:hypothetical protein
VDGYLAAVAKPILLVLGTGPLIFVRLRRGVNFSARCRDKGWPGEPKEITKLKCTLIAAAGALASAVVMPAFTTPSALAAAPKCLNKANKYVACTNKLKAKTQRKGAVKLQNSMVRSWSTSSDGTWRRRPLQLRRR